MKNEPSAATNPAIYSGSNLESCSIKMLDISNGTTSENSLFWKIVASKPFLNAALYDNISL